MIELSVSLASNGITKVPGYEQLVRFGYTKNRGVYRLHVDATGEWAGLAIRCFWHVPDGKDPASSLVEDGYKRLVKRHKMCYFYISFSVWARDV